MDSTILKAKDFRRISRESLSGKWGLALGTGFVAALLGGSINFVASGGGSSVRSGANSEQVNNIVSSLESGDLAIVMSVIISMLGAMLAVATVIWLVQFILGGAVSFGYAQFNMKLVNKDEGVTFNDLFSQFDRLWAGICMNFWMGLYVFLWSLLLIVPGILAAFSYSMTPYILSENKDMTAREAIAESKRMMKGHRWRFFCLLISFIGWEILAGFTFGIGNLWVRPYVETACAAFYMDLKNIDTNHVDIDH